MTKSEFQKKVIALLKKYQLHGRMQEKIIPLFSLADNLSQEEMNSVYHFLEEALGTRKKTEKFAIKLETIVNDFNKTLESVSRKLYELRKMLDQMGPQPDGETKKVRRGNFQREKNQNNYGNAMMYNKHSFPGEKPNFGLKLNKLFSAYITEYGPEYITMVVSDSILYTNNLILRLSLITKEVLIGSSKSIRFYEFNKNKHFLVTDKPEVIPYGNSKGFFFKYITYEDILNLTNGDFFKVFNSEILRHYKKYEIGLPEELRRVGYFKFE